MSVEAVRQFPVAHADSVAGPIEHCEDWLVKECARILNPADGGPFRSVESGPGEWSRDYLDRLIKAVPTARVAFTGGRGRNASELDLDSRWAIFLVTGLQGQREKDRRRNKGGRIGAWRAVSLLAPWLHNQTPGAGGVGQAHVERIDNLWSGDLDRLGLAVVAIILNVPLHFDAQIDGDQFDDFLRAGIAWDLETSEEEET